MPRIIDPISVCSLRVECRVNGRQLGTATGFVVQGTAGPLLATNWHVLSGRSPTTGQPLSPTGALPDELVVLHHVHGKLGTWAPRSESLYVGDVRRWREHPEGKAVDVATLPLSDLDHSVQLFPLDLALADADVSIQVAMEVSVIGFPFGLAVDGALPIWKTGHVASDPDFGYQNRPAFLVDVTSREGMSGSPVVRRVYDNFRGRDGSAHVAAGPQTRFLGIYSGRIHELADVGLVWRPDCLTPLL